MDGNDELKRRKRPVIYPLHYRWRFEALGADMEVTGFGFYPCYADACAARKTLGDPFARWRVVLECNGVQNAYIRWGRLMSWVEDPIEGLDGGPPPLELRMQVADYEGASVLDAYVETLSEAVVVLAPFKNEPPAGLPDGVIAFMPPL